VIRLLQTMKRPGEQSTYQEKAVRSTRKLPPGMMGDSRAKAKFDMALAALVRLGGRKAATALIEIGVLTAVCTTIIA